jgi:hypothetical protein
VITTVDLAAAGVSEAEPRDVDRVKVKGDTRPSDLAHIRKRAR